MAKFNPKGFKTGEFVPFLDTCWLINHYQEIEEQFYISDITLREIEDIKTSGKKSEEVKYKARGAARFLTNHPDLCVIVFADSVVANKLYCLNMKDTPDNLICASAAVIQNELNPYKVVFYTEDLSCRLIAQKLFKLTVSNPQTDGENTYKGYREISGTTEEINGNSVWTNTGDWHENEYCICTNTDTGETSEMRYTNGMFVPLRLPASEIVKGKNPLQRCVIDLLNNKEISTVAVLGTYGSGKTYLATRIGIHETVKRGNYSKFVAVRNPVGEGASVGFLPGGLEEKTFDFFLPIAQQLDMGVIELEKLREKGLVESTIPYYLKGQTFNESFITVDEAEDLSQKEIKLIGTRVGKGTKIVFCGDYKQSIRDTSENNAIMDMCRQLKGNPKFGCICLEEDVRSETSKMFASLWS